MALVTIESKDSVPSLDVAATKLGVAIEDIDAKLGVVPIDPDHGIYSVRVRADRLPEVSANSHSFQGPFSDPPIAPFKPVDDKPKE